MLFTDYKNFVFPLHCREVSSISRRSRHLIIIKSQINEYISLKRTIKKIKLKAAAFHLKRLTKYKITAKNPNAFVFGTILLKVGL